MARVLVVDDQNIPRRAVAGMLLDASYEVETAAGGEEGLSRARDWLPDVVVLDVYMPDMDGFEVVRRLKDDPLTESIPVVFLTAERPSDELIVRGLDAGAYDFLSKDCSRAELLARVGVMARIKRGHDELAAIARISDTLIRTLDPDAMADLFVEQAREVFRADAALLHVEADGGREIRAGSGVDAGGFPWSEVADSIRERLEQTGRRADVLELDELDGLDSAARQPLEERPLGSILAAFVRPSAAHSTLLVVFGGGGPGFQRESDRQLLEALTRQARIALDNAILHERQRRQAEELERAMGIRSRFFASMSHELRTPINALIGYNQLLQEGVYGDLSEAQGGAVENIARASNHLLELINDVLDISKIEAGKIEVAPEPTDLVLLLRDTLTSIRPQAESKGLALEIEAPAEAPLVTDPARVRQILLNLLSNAVKFTDEGEVRVRIEREGAEYALTVSDTGPGIAPEHQARIFEEFEQVAAAVSRGGTGLGLPISKRLASLLGGALTLESELGVGSRFTLMLPRAAPDASDEAEPGQRVEPNAASA